VIAVDLLALHCERDEDASWSSRAGSLPLPMPQSYAQIMDAAIGELKRGS
jgi:hypothetical protein